MSIPGLVLAGGRSSRMGGVDKAFLPFAGRTLIARAIDRLAPQVDRVWISANGDPARFAEFGLDVFADPVEGFAGPLAGVLAGLRAARALGSTRLATVAVDTPFFPSDLVARLAGGALDEIAVASTLGRLHPVAALWPVALADEISHALARQNARVMAFVTARPHRIVTFDATPIDPFMNLNTPDDFARAATLAEAGA